MFNLAPLQRIEPDKIVSKGKPTRFESFMLALALFYNDWKGFAWFKNAILEPQKPQGKTIDPYTGQWVGLSVQFSRLQIGALHEFMKLLKEEQKIAEGREIGNLIASIPKENRAAWKSLVSTALGKSTEPDPLTNALERIRNSLAFHYYQPKGLARGFQEFFFESDREGNDAAFYSVGGGMEQTRFYYADAAANLATIMQAQAAGTANLGKDASEVGNRIHPALGVMLERYLSERRRSST
jgi:hypothetical protein